MSLFSLARQPINMSPREAYWLSATTVEKALFRSQNQSKSIPVRSGIQIFHEPPFTLLTSLPFPHPSGSSNLQITPRHNLLPQKHNPLLNLNLLRTKRRIRVLKRCNQLSQLPAQDGE
ncbi:hypothetical protein VC83_07876 [Pseudogymnoascus destructans]|uniref:Uncharacterized protein n=1 Tax=Pseudogymnoascus destructans TaxID=655981 RepID=A0A177A408_9PEZI|nr:uncharacterized protein VC83_07876 [Pseudogymnoascus destructans]OAF55813.1 hypothetical protein VC83_07876 [Pseudogymnoascus destructans]